MLRVLIFAFVALVPSLHGESPLVSMERTILSQINPGPEFQIDTPHPGGPVLNAGDFGFLPTADGESNVKGLRNALEACRQAKASRLIFLPGSYRLKSDGVTSVRDPQYAGKVFAIELTNLTDFIFDASGTEFIFEQPSWITEKARKQGGYFFIHGNTRVKLLHLTLDWDWAKLPLGFFAVVSDLDPKAGTVDYKLDPDFTRHFKDPFSVFVMRGWDPATGTRSEAAFNFSTGQLAEQKRTDEDHFRFTFKNPKSMSVARIADAGIFKTDTPWYAIAFVVDENEHLSFDRIKLHGSPGNGVWARKNKYFEIVHSAFTPRPGTKPVYVTHSALEIHNHFGYFRMEDNLIEWQHDDGLHFSDHFLPASWERLGPDTIRVKGLMYFQSADTFRLNDRLTFRGPDFERLGQSPPIADFQWTMAEGTGQARHYVTLKFKENLSGEFPTNSCLFNEDAFGVGRYVIRSNVIRNGLCMGLAVHMPNGLIEGNVVSNIGYPGLQVSMMLRWTRWTIGHVPTNIIVRGNILSRVNRAVHTPADLFTAAGVEPQGKDFELTRVPLLENILLEGNVVRESPLQALVIGSSKNIVVRNNVFIHPNRESDRPGATGVVMIKNSAHIVIDGNRLEEAGDSRRIVCNGTVSNVLIGRNPGFVSDP